MSVIVTGADQRQGLAIIRTLGKRGIPVYAGGPNLHSKGFYSRYTKDYFVYPSPYKDKRKFIDEILRKARQYKVELIIPAVESTLIALDEFREEVEKVVPIAAASSQSLHMTMDKKETLELAKSLGILIPKTLYIDNLNIVPDELEYFKFPVVMKRRAPRSYPGIPQSPDFKVAYANHMDELKEVFNELKKTGSEILLQEYCKGAMLNICILMDDGEVLAIQQYNSIQSAPITGGVGVYREYIPVIPQLLSSTVKLLSAMNWKGVAHVSYIYDATSNKYYFMEVNGRFWASVGGSVNTGVDFPFMQYELFAHNKKVIQKNYIYGKRNRWLKGQIICFIDYLFSNRYNHLKFLPSKSEILSHVLEGLNPRLEDDIFSWDDIYPSVNDRVELIQEIVEKTGQFITTRCKDRIQIDFNRIATLFRKRVEVGE